MATIPKDGLREAALREAAIEYRAAINAVRQALERVICTGAPNAPGWIDLEALYPDSAVVEVAGKCWSYPYTLAEDGAVTLGVPVQVVEQYTPVNAAPANARVESEGGGAAMIEAVAADGQPAGTVWRVWAIRAGLSLNKMNYSDALLREAASLFEGVRVFEKTDDEHLRGQGKATRNLIGQLRNASYKESAPGEPGGVQAELHLLESSGLPAKLVEMDRRGMLGLVGFSIDAVGAIPRQVGLYREAVSILKIKSLDLIVEPGAGGRIINLIESVGAADMALRQRMILAVSAAHGGKLPAALDPDDDDALEAAYREAVAAPPPGGQDAAQDALRRLDAMEMREAVAASGLPDYVQGKLLDKIKRGTTLETLREAIADQKDILARHSQAGRVTGLGGLSVEPGESRAEKVRTMLDDFFSLDKPAFSFRECYAEITGDAKVTGIWRNCDQALLREAAGADFREAVDSGTFAYILGDSITRQLIRLYSLPDQWSDWEWLVDVVPLKDFRVNERTRMGGYGDLPIVGQGDPYEQLATPGDVREQYAPQKRGGIEQITREAIMNDDVGALRRIPQMLSTAAKRTLYKFVYSFLTANPTMGDGTALFHANRGNLGSAALSADAWYAARLAKHRTAELSSGEPQGIVLNHIAGPAELEKTAYDLFVRGTNNDATFVQSQKATFHLVTHWTDPSDWVGVADKSQIPLIELGFISGNHEPELFMQDMPNVGSVFANDVLAYKIRHEYGANVLSPDGFYKSVVP